MNLKTALEDRGGNQEELNIHLDQTCSVKRDQVHRDSVCDVFLNCMNYEMWHESISSTTDLYVKQLWSLLLTLLKFNGESSGPGTVIDTGNKKEIRLWRNFAYRADKSSWTCMVRRQTVSSKQKYSETHSSEMTDKVFRVLRWILGCSLTGSLPNRFMDSRAALFSFECMLC